MHGPYRTAPPEGPIRQGHFDDFNEMAFEIRKASRQLGLVVRLADSPNALLLGFKVGHYHWSITTYWASRTCPKGLKTYLTTMSGRARIASALSNPKTFA